MASKRSAVLPLLAPTSAGDVAADSERFTRIQVREGIQTMAKVWPFLATYKISIALLWHAWGGFSIHDLLRMWLPTALSFPIFLFHEVVLEAVELHPRAMLRIASMIPAVLITFHSYICSMMEPGILQHRFFCVSIGCLMLMGVSWKGVEVDGVCAAILDLCLALNWLAFHHAVGWLSAPCIATGCMFVLLLRTGRRSAFNQSWQRFTMERELQRERQLLAEAQANLHKVLSTQHSMLTSLFDAWCVCDESGHLSLASAQMRHLFVAGGGSGCGWPKTALVGRALWELAMDPHERERLRDFMQRARSATGWATTIQSSLDATHEAAQSAGREGDVNPSHRPLEARLFCIALPGAQVCVEPVSGPTPASDAPWLQRGFFVGLQVQAPVPQEDGAEHPPGDAEGTVELAGTNGAKVGEEYLPGVTGPVEHLEEHEAFLAAEPEPVLAQLGESPRSTAPTVPTLASACRAWPRLPVAEVPPECFAQHLVLGAPEEVRHALWHAARMAQGASGGCAFAVATWEAFSQLQRQRLTDYQVVDRSERWPCGYMTTRLRGVNVAQRAFAEAVNDFTAHAAGDRWPVGHEAEGLPKDGFVALLDLEGYRLKCATRLIGLPPPPFRWDGVGTRHLAALGACWALRGAPSAVVVRSDAGALHGLVARPSGLAVLRARCGA